MAENMRKNHEAAFKSKVALEALKGDRFNNLRTGIEKGNPAQEKLSVFQDAARRLDRRYLHEPDPHLQLGRHQRLRISGCPPEKSWRRVQKPAKLDAMESPSVVSRRYMLAWKRRLLTTVLCLTTQS